MNIHLLSSEITFRSSAENIQNNDHESVFTKLARFDFCDEDIRFLAIMQLFSLGIRLSIKLKYICVTTITISKFFFPKEILLYYFWRGQVH